MAGDELQVAFVAELAGVRGFVAKELEAGDAPSLLINRDDWLNPAEFAELVGELAELCGGLDVASEEDEPSRLNPADEVCVGGIHFDSGDAKEQKLTGGGAFHTL